MRACERAAAERRFDREAEFLRERLLHVIPAEDEHEVEFGERRLIPVIGGEG